MAGVWTNVFSFVAGVLRSPEIAYLVRVADELVSMKVSHSYATVWHRGRWMGGDIEQLKWTTVGAASCSVPREQGVILGLWGDVLCLGSGDVHQEKIGRNSVDSPEHIGPMRGIKGIAGKAYAVGMNRQVYRRDGAGLWVSIDQGVRASGTGDLVASFEAIDGFDESEIYAVGRLGEIWLYDGHMWRSANSPTNIILTSVCCGGDGYVYVAGRMGTVLRGRHDRWEFVAHGDTQEDFWSIAWFDKKIYLSTLRFAYVLSSEDRLQLVDFGEGFPSTCFHLSAVEGALWSIGAKDVMAFDGISWTRIE